MMKFARITLWIFATLFSAKSLSQAQPNTESAIEIRVTFLYHIINYSRWQSETSALTFCVLEDLNSPKYLPMLTSVAFSNGSQTPISMRAIERVEEVTKKQCNYLFVDKDNESEQLFQQLAQLNQSVVSIGESSRFVDSGGMMSLVEEFNKIKIYINRDKYKSAPIKFSARLLKHANFTG